MAKQTAQDEWKADLPDWMKDQRNQMTGPADNEKLVVQLINSGSPGVMLDIEDSMANTEGRLLAGHRNIKEALLGRAYYYKTTGANSVTTQIRANPNGGTVIFLRVRGLHLDQFYPTKTKTSVRMSASLFDLAMHFYDLVLEDLPHAPCIYIPKSEGAHEANWWKKAFVKIEKAKGWPAGTIKCMALVESHPMAYEMEEFAFNLQPYLVGLNLGRWDYMASLIDFMYHEDDWLFPDRNEIPSDVPFFQNLRHWMAHVCHKHGMLAIGGMSALYPDRKNKKLNTLAQKKLKADKENEAACLMDGAWTGHPDQNDIAVNAFPSPNQLDKMPGLTDLPDLREFKNDLPVTEEGTREAIRVCIQYRQAVLDGKGAKLINGFMEDLATDRIYRVMIAQRIDRGVHTQTEFEDMMAEEMQKLNSQFEYDNHFSQGASATMDLINTRQFDPK
jgi:malate synthase